MLIGRIVFWSFSSRVLPINREDKYRCTHNVRQKSKAYPSQDSSRIEAPCKGAPIESLIVELAVYGEERWWSGGSDSEVRVLCYNFIISTKKDCSA
jgi:hypothetical protein